MTPERIREAIKTMKDAGASKLPLPLNVIEKLVTDAEQWRKLPPMAQEAWKR